MTDRELLEQILQNQTSMQEDIRVLTQKVDSIQNQGDNIQNQVGIIREQVAENTEQLGKISKSLDFTKSRQTDIEEEVYHIKKKIS